MDINDCYRLFCELTGLDYNGPAVRNEEMRFRSAFFAEEQEERERYRHNGRRMSGPRAAEIRDTVARRMAEWYNAAARGASPAVARAQLLTGPPASWAAIYDALVPLRPAALWVMLLRAKHREEGKPAPAGGVTEPGPGSLLLCKSCERVTIHTILDPVEGWVCGCGFYFEGDENNDQ
jgi:hypothetical protein